MAAGFFAISTITSFMAPALKRFVVSNYYFARKQTLIYDNFQYVMCRCTKPNMIPVHMEQLTPIDEEPAEDNDDDQPITMSIIPKIMHTAPSPTNDEIPPIASNVTSTTTVNNEQTPRHVPADAHKNRNSFVDASIVEASVEQESGKDNTRVSAKESITSFNEIDDNKVSQIESVL